jgi:hypothetical protein
MTLFSPMTFADAPSSTTARRRVPTSVALVIAVAGTLAVLGAFGTYVSMSLPLRLLHFLSVALVIGAMVHALSETARRFVFDGALPFWAALVIAAVAAPPGAWIVQQSLALWAPISLRYVGYFELTMQVLALNMLIGSLAWTLRQRVGTQAVARDARPVAGSSTLDLRAKLPAPCRHASILALSAEDHYVRVRTDRGDGLILMNFTAAIEALGDGAGVRIHRSHWVSRHVATEAVTKGHRKGHPSIRVDDDTLLPVSRAGRKLLHDLRSE